MSEAEVRGSRDDAVEYLLKKAQENNIETGWDRFNAMQEVCAFGNLGLCCRNCMMGPCRIDPFGEGPQKGICGISSDGIVARNLCRMIISGTSAHSDHAAHILEVFRQVSAGEPLDFEIRDESKLANLMKWLGLEFEGKDTREVITGLVCMVKDAFSDTKVESDWLLKSVPAERLDKLRVLDLIPRGIDPVIRETMHRTHMGVDADPLNLLLAGLKCSLADFLGMDIASTLSDILLGTPVPTFSSANLGVIDPDAVNVAVHGHNPLIAESIVRAVTELQEKAKEAGAANGINVVGVCCTGNEVLMRRGIPLATNMASQEIPILTGALDAMVADVQCVMPSLASLCECYHTELITTMPIAKIPGAQHIEFEPAEALQCAQKILDTAIECYTKRDKKKIDIPDIKQETLVGFSPEAILSLLSKINQDDPLKPLIDKIANGDIYGVVLLAGCNNYRVVQDSGFIGIAERLAKDNILMLATGCAAGAFAKSGLLSPEATMQICGDKLAKLLGELGDAAGLGRPLPPVWHMGSCVDNSRVARLCFALANKLGVDLDQLPVVASAPEAMSEKSVSIATWAVTLGITTHLGILPPVLGGKVVTKILTETLKDLLGAYFIVEPDPAMASQKIKEIITQKRIGLGLK
jgi:carbon-monoxide dehydrogenase catalytic subunit